MKDDKYKNSGPPEAALPDKLAGLSQAASFSAGVLLVPAVAVLVLAALGFLLTDNPGRTLYFLFIGPFRNLYSFGNMLNAAIPLVLGALGVTIAMKCGNLNLGGEGQIYTGAFTAAAAALALPETGFFGVIIAVLAAVLASGTMAAFSGFCKAKWNVNELISTFLLSAAAIPVVNYFISGPFLDPQTSLISTEKIAPALRLSLVLKPSLLSTAAFAAALAVVLVHLFLYKTKKGYELRMAGHNEIFARYAGINTKLNTVLAMFLSGGFYGLAGALAVLGTYHSVIKEFSFGLGWNGLAAALVAGFYIPAIIPAALFFAWIGSGTRLAMQNSGLLYETASIVQAFILLLSTSLVIRNIFSDRKKRSRP